MGFLKSSALVLLCAVILNKLPGWFQEKNKVPPVIGFVAPGWESVRDVYRQNFEDGDDTGSSLSVYYKGKPVVDLRGGFANEKELWPWQENTITRLYSTTKGIGAVVIGVLADRGFIKYDELVTKYWPEFGAHGKENVTVEMLLSHQAGLVTISDKSYSVWDEINDVKKLGRLLAEEKPKWEIGTGVGYHTLTIGLYMDQLVRRVDPKHRGMAEYFHEEIAEPFGIDIQLGLKDSDVYRATVLESQPLKLKYLARPEVRNFLKLFLIDWANDGEPNYMQESLNAFVDPEIGNILYAGVRPDVNKLWNPSFMGHGNAHSLAKLYGILANGGSANGKQLMSSAMVQLQTLKIKSGKDKCLRLETTYGRGYRIDMSPMDTPMFGTPGLGGQMGYADPAHKLGIGFTSNYLSYTGLKDHRYVPLEREIYKALENMK